MISKASDGVMRISISRTRAESGIGTPDESGMELEENLQTTHSILSVVDVRTSN